MITNLTEQELIDFEEDIANCFAQKMIRAPIHLQHSCEKQLIEIFQDIKEENWCVGSWRFHQECLLKGVSKEELKEAILNGRSMGLCFKKQKIICSAIVHGNVPIALGIAWDIKRKGEDNHVWCFIGDMTSAGGTFHECLNYAVNHDLPITFVVADNSKSVCTDTKKTWNTDFLPYEPDESFVRDGKVFKSKHLYWYRYKMEKYPHAGGRDRVQF